MPEFPEYSDLVAEEVMVKSHDRLEVLLSIIYKEGLKRTLPHHDRIKVRQYFCYSESLSFRRFLRKCSDFPHNFPACRNRLLVTFSIDSSAFL